MEVVVVLGASKDPARYSYKAQEMLKEYGHRVIPVHPHEKEIQGLKVVNKLEELVGQKIDTVTVYVNSNISSQFEDDLLKLSPKRVIFNPGAENNELFERLSKNGIKVENACTLVLLRTGQY
jgi:predicted CoA-binding protein